MGRVQIESASHEVLWSCAGNLQQQSDSCLQPCQDVGSRVIHTKWITACVSANAFLKARMFWSGNCARPSRHGTSCAASIVLSFDIHAPRHAGANCILIKVKMMTFMTPDHQSNPEALVRSAGLRS